jgi:hypothetical protein
MTPKVNKQPNIEEGQTMQWQTEKGQQGKHYKTLLRKPEIDQHEPN